MISKQIFSVTFLNEHELIFLKTVKLFHLLLSNANAQLNIKIVLFQIIQFNISKLNCYKYCYVSLTIQLNISHLFSNS